jgi:chemotaxis methyl-accepting protein methylase
MDCIALLQWALPQLELQWSGFRKVRRQVCKRLKRRITELQLDNFAAYRARLAVNPAEWIIFDQCCHITISRFFRDKGLFETVRRRLLPEIAVRAKREQRDARIWSAGCASGEEPYSLKILWDLEIADLFPEVSVSIIATDIDNTMLVRGTGGMFQSDQSARLSSARWHGRLWPQRSRASARSGSVCLSAVPRRILKGKFMLRHSSKGLSNWDGCRGAISRSTIAGLPIGRAWLPA